MSVKVRPCGRGHEVDIRWRSADGRYHRDRKRVSITSKSAAQRWGELREQKLLQEAANPPAPPAKEVPTLTEFAPRFLNGYAVANRHKPSGIASKESILRVHLLPALGKKTLDAITGEDVQRLKLSLLSKAPKTTNNILTVLRTLLKTAVAWGVIERMPCAIPEVRAPKRKMEFLDFDEFERLVEAAGSLDSTTLVVVLLAGEAGLRAGEIMGLRRQDVDLVSRRLSVAQSIWRGHVTATKGERCRYIKMTRRLVEAIRQHRHLRSEYVVCNADGRPLSYKQVWAVVKRAGQKAQVLGAAHRLRHTFCSHLAMRGAPALAIKELAGHRSLATTQGYMHLSPAAADSAITLLDERIVTRRFGEMWETAVTESAK